jgi:hypothetical protein
MMNFSVAYLSLIGVMVMKADMAVVGVTVGTDVGAVVPGTVVAAVVGWGVPCVVAVTVPGKEVGVTIGTADRLT